MRYNTALEVILFVFIGFCFGIKNNRSLNRNSSLLGGVFVIGHYGVYLSCVSMAKNLVLPAELAIIVPMTIAFCVGMLFYRKLDWAS